MEVIEETPHLLKKIKLFIVDEDLQYVKNIKDFLEKEFREPLNVKSFPTGESALEEIKKIDEKPEVVVLDYLGNKQLDTKNEKHTVDDISNISPDTGIIIISDKKYENRAMKALAHGAHDFIVKDKFTLKHLLNSIKKVLHPPKC